ncbi:MAG: recombinase RecA [Candidatus Methanoperedens sp.]|nr:recombinase RecA [Candidatus Methanoperedens sp.]MCZ7358826.1 recombinase RecA [Candidatus Methanoperedens sp.]HLB69716.1 ATPase domain-containing protein [Candidatus Methanoperedens sp.]
MEIGIKKLDELMNGGIKKGSNILLIGPPMSGKNVILNHMMYNSASKHENAVISVNTYEPGTRVLEWFRENKLNLPASRIGIVDCTTRMIGGEADEDEIIKIANSPVDLTLIGIKISQLFDRFFIRKNVKNIQLNINSLSALLMYSNIKTVFKFLHVFTGRIKAMRGLGIYVMESGVHDILAVGTLNQLFDGIIEVKVENDRNFIRVSGLSQKTTPWLEYEIDGANIRIG